LLQRWRRFGQLFQRVDFGNEPVRSDVLGAWLIPQQGRLGIAEDREGARPWLTDAEEERAAKEQERALREALEREVLELRAKLGAREAR
jgi:hypothetical protein